MQKHHQHGPVETLSTDFIKKLVTGKKFFEFMHDTDSARGIETFGTVSAEFWSLGTRLEVRNESWKQRNRHGTPLAKSISIQCRKDLNSYVWLLAKPG